MIKINRLFVALMLFIALFTASITYAGDIISFPGKSATQCADILKKKQKLPLLNEKNISLKDQLPKLDKSSLFVFDSLDSVYAKFLQRVYFLDDALKILSADGVYYLSETQYILKTFKKLVNQMESVPGMALSIISDPNRMYFLVNRIMDFANYPMEKSYVPQITVYPANFQVEQPQFISFEDQVRENFYTLPEELRQKIEAKLKKYNFSLLEKEVLLAEIKTLRSKWSEFLENKEN